jgi:hypothetical protein
MKKSPDLSETLSKGANEAKEILQQAASLIEDEWKRVKGNLDESESVPDGVKTAVARLGDAVDEMREFVSERGPQVVSSATKAARQAGVPIPDSWGADEADEAAPSPGDTIVEDAVVDDAVEDTAVEDTVADTADAADEDVEDGSDKSA